VRSSAEMRGGRGRKDPMSKGTLKKKSAAMGTDIRLRKEAEVEGGTDKALATVEVAEPENQELNSWISVHNIRCVGGQGKLSRHLGQRKRYRGKKLPPSLNN